MSNIVVIGSSNTDMVVKAPSIPRAGETLLGGAFFQAGGGKGANQAVAAARAGGTVTLVAAVGDDALGSERIGAFAREGIDASQILRIPGQASGVALIVVDAAGENCIVVAPGANGSLGPERIRELEPVLAAADVVVLQLEIPLETVAEAVRLAAAHGVRVLLNPAPGRPLPDEVTSRVTVLTPNETEVELLTGIAPDTPEARGEAASMLLARGAGAVVLTLGSAGAYLATADGHEIVPGHRVTPVDTTGAGDVFNGALAVALAENRDLADALRFANAAAAISVTREGAQPSAPMRHEIDRLLDSSTLDPGRP